MDPVAKIATISLELGETRKATDKLFIIIFLINIVVWLWTGINNVHEMYEADKRDIFFSGMFETILIRTGVHGIIAIAVSLLLIFLQNLLKFRGTVFLAIFAIAIKILALLILIPWLIYMILHSYFFLLTPSLTIIALIITIVALIHQVIIFICIKEAEKTVLSELINESSRAALHSFFPIIFSVLTSFLLIVISFFTVIVSQSMISKTLEYSDVVPVLHAVSSFRTCVFAFEGLFIINFICNFGFIVTGDCLVHYYGAADKQNFSKFYIFRSMIAIVRNHLGTVALLSTPILPRICALIMSFSSNKDYYNKKSDNKLVKFTSKISLIMNITDFALIQTSIYGSNALKSTREMLDLHKYTLKLFLSFNTISTKVIGISTGIAILVIIIGRGIIFDFILHSNYHNDWPINSAVLIMTFIYTIFLHKILICPAMSAFSIYKMINIRTSGSSEQMIFT